jgi:ubiquitin carboxyl-terminal hydrolase 5/13
MASVLQTLFALPEFADRYFTKGSAHALLCSNPAPASCFECQMSKVGDGLLSGRYAVPRAGDADADATAEHYAPAGSEVLEPASASQPVPAGTHVNRPFQAGIRPSMFKALVGKDHEEFKTMRQQDAEEFFRHLVGMIQRQSRNAGASSGGGAGGGRGSGGDGEDAPLDPTRVFQFEMEERLQCTDCKGVRYKTVAEETLSLPVPFVPKTAGATAAAMEIDESAPADTSEGKGKAPIEGENAAPPTAAAPAASVGMAGPASDAKDKEEWEPVQIEECLNLLTSSATIEYKCPKCDKNVHANKSTRFATFPDTLVVHATRFRLHNWVPQKVGAYGVVAAGERHSLPDTHAYSLCHSMDISPDVPILIPSVPLSLDRYLGAGQQEGEELLPEDTSASTASTIELNATAMAQLEGMGFPSVRAQKALLATGNTGDADAAMNWLFAHMEDADIDDPIPAAQLQVSSAAGTTGASAGAAGAPAEQIAALAEMGFTPNQARKALRETGGSADAAVEWLFSHPDDAGEAEGEASAEASSSPTGGAEPRGSRALPAEYRLKAFISHRGPSAASGHYVAHVHLPQVGWVFFNDEKVGRVQYLRAFIHLNCARSTGQELTHSKSSRNPLALRCGICRS